MLPTTYDQILKQNYVRTQIEKIFKESEAIDELYIHPTTEVKKTNIIHHNKWSFAKMKLVHPVKRD